MTIFLWTMASFLVGLIIHVIWWKVAPPAGHMLWIFLIFAGTFVAEVAVFIWAKQPLSVGLAVALYYWSVCLCYIITYSAIEADSPTLSLIHDLDARGGVGMTEAELDIFVRSRPFVSARLAALISDGLVRQENGKYYIAGKRSLFFTVVLGFRRLYGRVERGG